MFRADIRRPLPKENVGQAVLLFHPCQSDYASGDLLVVIEPFGAQIRDSRMSEKEL
jgi:hypothetical protein